ncbi:putative thymidylate kinase [Cokeromyces recurvatus]|uniref:putative thymidylate kinase n=1 Tax=Cokeromyces recurvatus TaxID=90255 RepID=UPI002220D974|nr:putative thymidylate kinase [Cokeromyces recurvatus]KAI7903531.1 putative thymidylate kinase [Cokeromyces recurvatus]
MTQRGLFIVVEGCDRSGKSTHCAKLVEKLNSNGIDAELIKFPDRTTQTGKMIDSYLQQKSDLDDHAIHLLFSANRWEAMKILFEKLKNGKTLVVDRYAFSGVAFSSAKGLDLEWCKNPDIGLLTPDLVLFLDLDINEAEKRGGFGEERYEKRELQIKVREEFMKLKDESWKLINAGQSKEKVEQDIWAVIEEARNSLDTTKSLQYNLWK